MTKKIRVLIAALVCLLFLGCDFIVKKIEVESETEPKSNIVGTWYCKLKNEMYAFKLGGSGILADDEGFHQIIYSINDGVVDTYYKGNYMLSINYKEGGDTFVLGGLTYERLERNGIIGLWYNEETNWVFAFNPSYIVSICDSNGNTTEYIYEINDDNETIAINGTTLVVSYSGGDTFELDNPEFAGFVFTRQ